VFIRTEMGVESMFYLKTSKNMYRDGKTRYTIFICTLNKIVKYSIWKGMFVLPQPLYTFLILPWVVKINVE